MPTHPLLPSSLIAALWLFASPGLILPAPDAAPEAKPAAVSGGGDGFPYAVVHYNRPAADYGDHTTGDYTDFWGLHLWGDAIDPDEVTDWTAPKPFLGEDEFGRFAWIKRSDAGSIVNFIIHQGDTKDGDPDRSFDADAQPEIWINAGDLTIYTSQAEAQGFVTVRYHRDDGDYGTPGPDYNDFWGLHLWGDAIDPSEATDWAAPKPPTGIDAYGAFWQVAIVDAAQPLNFIIHRGDLKDPGPDESFVPAEQPTVWKQSGDVALYPSRGAAEDVATLHYHRPAGDYGDPTSPDFNDFWGMHVWDGAASPNPAWQDPVRPDRFDTFGAVFEVDLVDAAPLLAYILHRGDTKDPGPDQFLVFEDWGYEVWQIQDADPTIPYIYPISLGLLNDLDGDGVANEDDLCPDTAIPEAGIPAVALRANRFALVDDDCAFDTASPGGKDPKRGYTTADTRGCSCEQIVDRMGMNPSDARFGCTIRTLDAWIASIGGAPKRGGRADEIAADDDRPTQFELEGGYPNPFNPQTTVRFALPDAAEVQVAVYDVLGRRVRVLVDGLREAGRHTVVFRADGLPSGTYLVRLDTPQGGFVESVQLAK